LLPSLIALILAASPAGADLGGDWTWADARAVEGVDPGKVEWLESHVPLAEARRLARLALRLSEPEAATLMAAYPHLDGSVRAFAPEDLARIAERPPEGEAGVVHVLHTVAFTRHALTERREARAPGVFRNDFRGGAVRLPSPRAAPDGVRLALDFSPARRLLALVRRGEQDPGKIRAALEGPEFDALLKHRSQGFYSQALTWEMLSTNLALAGGDDPVAALYREANPGAFYDFGDVRRHLESYQSLLAALETGKSALAAEVAARIEPALPPGARLERRVSFFFAAGADGWASDGVAAVDLEYYKDDVDRLLRLLTHETYHAAQVALGPAEPEGETSAGEDALEVLFAEGTATWLAPPKELDETARAEQVVAARGLLAEIADAQSAGDPDRASRALREGTAGAGPFYWLGAAMADAIARTDGAAGVGATLPGGHAAFVAAYRSAAARIADPPVDPALLERLRPR